MTPEEYVARIGELVTTGKDQEALDFSGRHHRGIAPTLTDEQLERVSGLLEGAAMAVSLEAWFGPSPAPAADHIEDLHRCGWLPTERGERS